MLEFIPDFQVASKFTFCCNISCREVKPNKKINRFERAVGVDAMLKTKVEQTEFGTCQLQLEGWRTNIYDFTIVGLQSFKLLPSKVGKWLRDVHDTGHGFGCVNIAEVIKTIQK